jgi:flagellar biosynthesis GTPase FlhF
LNDRSLELDLVTAVLSVLREPESFQLLFAPTTILATVSALTSASIDCPANCQQQLESSLEEIQPQTSEKSSESCSSSLPAPSALSASEAIAISASVSAGEKFKKDGVYRSIVNALLSRLIQGSASTLSNLFTACNDIVSELAKSISSSELDGEMVNERKNLLLQEFSRLLSCSSSTELFSTYIEPLARREEYGYRPKSDSSSKYEDESLVAVLRWECNSTVFFNKASQGVIREIRSVRGRYSRGIKAFAKVIEQIHKTPALETVQTKITPLEEKAAKVVEEIAKQKAKRFDFEQKKVLELESKLKKQEEADKKKKEREEAEAKKKEQQEHEKQAKLAVQLEKEKAKNEKTQKTVQVLEKQQSFFKNFLKNPAVPSTASSAVSSATSKPISSSDSAMDASSVSTEAQFVDMTESSTPPKLKKSCIAATSSSSSLPMIIDLEAEEQRCRFFCSAIDKNLSFQELLSLRRSHHLSVNNGRKRRAACCRQPKVTKLTVLSSTSSGTLKGSTINPFDLTSDENNYADYRQVQISNHYRHLYFAEDFRPAYVGTFSKKSTVVSGRRPFAKDKELFNYDYDSEGEWEEEEVCDGEDLGEDDGDDDEELDEYDKANKNEFIYDEFFREDNDFGSDCDSDGEELIGCALPNFAKIKEEVAGLRFISSLQLTQLKKNLVAASSQTPVSPSSSSSSSLSSSSSPTSVAAMTLPIILKPDPKQRSSLHSTKYSTPQAHMKAGNDENENSEEATVDPSPLRVSEIRDWKDDYDTNQLMNYYPIIYQPSLLSLSLTDDGKNGNKEKKKRDRKKKTSEVNPNTLKDSSLSKPDSSIPAQSSKEGEKKDTPKETKPRKKVEKKVGESPSAEGATEQKNEKSSKPVVKQMLEKILAQKRDAATTNTSENTASGDVPLPIFADMTDPYFTEEKLPHSSSVSSVGVSAKTEVSTSSVVHIISDICFFQKPKSKPKPIKSTVAKSSSSVVAVKTAPPTMKKITAFAIASSSTAPSLASMMPIISCSSSAVKSELPEVVDLVSDPSETETSPLKAESQPLVESPIVQQFQAAVSNASTVDVSPSFENITVLKSKPKKRVTPQVISPFISSSSSSSSSAVHSSASCSSGSSNSLTVEQENVHSNIAVVGSDANKEVLSK